MAAAEGGREEDISEFLVGGEGGSQVGSNRGGGKTEMKAKERRTIGRK